MPKQHSLYHPAGVCHVISLPGNKRAWVGHTYTGAFPFTGIPGKPVLLCIILFTASFFAGSSTGHKSTIVQDKETICTPIAGPAKQDTPFTFEYSGLFHLKVIISTDAFFISDIDITTTAQTSSELSFKNCNTTHESCKRQIIQ